MCVVHVVMCAAHAARIVSLVGRLPQRNMRLFFCVCGCGRYGYVDPPSSSQSVAVVAACKPPEGDGCGGDHVDFFVQCRPCGRAHG